MPERTMAPYGSWKSPITSDLIAGGSIRLGNVALDGDNLYWLESRPTEGGRYVLVRRGSDGGATLQVEAKDNDGTPMFVCDARHLCRKFAGYGCRPS